MRKIKISELPICRSLRGLFTIGTDSENRSVKVSLEFIETETDNAVRNANNAAIDANAVAQSARNAAADARTATINANRAIRDANAAKLEATQAAERAELAQKEADTAANLAMQAATGAQTSANACRQATSNCLEATNNSIEATQSAISAAEQALLVLGTFIPSGLEVHCVRRMTIGNTQSAKIDVKLFPQTAIRNYICISDNRAVSVSPDGELRAISKGESIIYVVPTCNTSLAKKIRIEVAEPAMRLTRFDNLRLSASGNLRLY